MKHLNSSLLSIAITIFTICNQQPVHAEKPSNAGDEMIEVEIYDKILHEQQISLQRTYSAALGTPVDYDKAEEGTKAKMIIRVGDYDWKLTTGNHYKALKAGKDYIKFTKGNPLRHSGGGSLTTFNLDGVKAVKRYLDSK